MTARELYQLDPAASTDLFNEGWRAGREYAADRDRAAGWTRGYLMGILTACLALALWALL